MTITSDSTEAVPEGLDDPQPPIKGLRRLFIWIIPANIGIFILWGSILGILLPAQIAGIDPANKIANLAIIATIGSFTAMIGQPIAGLLSDRTRSRFGRRSGWIIGGAIIGGLGLVGMAASSTIVEVAIAATIMQVAYNFAQGPLSAVLPDRVPRKSRGTFSALSGLGVMVGALGGQILGSKLAANIPVGYLFLAGFSIIILSLFVIFNPDHSSKEQVNEPFSLSIFLHTFWVSPTKHPDFFWAFTGRLLLYTGYFMVTGYQLYILTDYIHLGSAGALAAIPLFGIASLLGIIVATVVAGPISDRIGRRKPFVFASSILVGAALIIPMVSPTFAGWLAFSVVSGLGFGAFQSVDQALMSEVLPSATSFGKDLGVVNIAATLPQTIAPAVAGFIILSFGGYIALFPIGIVLSILGAFAVWFIKAVK
ncbi:MFS transporter [Diaminobutyricibacter sp. McL0618]|uniref:MFS transporter n=1 Tax=Leifsonia sp. McL0618 TaxID=3415677 RepID=UPI003CEE9068